MDAVVDTANIWVHNGCVDVHATDGLRERLTLAAVEMLERVKEEGLSLREVARACNVSHNAPYRHFSSKENLLAAVATIGFRRLTERLRSVEHLSVGRLAEVYITFALEEPEMLRLMFKPWEECGDEGSSLTAAAAEAFAILVGTVRSEYPDQSDHAALQRAVALWSLVHGYASLKRDRAFDFLPPDGLPSASVLAELIR